MGDVAMRSNAIWMASAALTSSSGSRALVELFLDKRTPMPQTDIVVVNLRGLSLLPAATIVRKQLVKPSAR